MKTTINWKRGGRIFVVVVDLGGKGGVSLPLRHCCLRAAKTKMWGRERGGG